MRKIVLIIVFLFLATVLAAALYFSKLKLPGQNTRDVISEIPNDAALVFEFKNDPEFYDLFKSSSLLTSFIGEKKVSELKFLHDLLIGGTNFDKILNDESIFISVHPGIDLKNIDLLITTGATENEQLSKAIKEAVLRAKGSLDPQHLGNKTFYSTVFPRLNEVFYFATNDGVLAGSFSKDLLIKFLDDRKETKSLNFSHLSDQQNKNSIANLYINYQQFPDLFKQLFKYQSDDFFRFLNGFPAGAALSLNYKSDALLFNGYTKTDTTANSYLQIFLRQNPVKNLLKAIYPINTALAVCFSYAKPEEFLNALNAWQTKSDGNKKANALFDQIKKETGVSIKSVFQKQLDNEFAVITTSESEKIALIKVKNGSEFSPYLHNLSIDPNAGESRLKYPNLAYFLLGEPLLNFKQPYFVLIDNYLLLANSQAALHNYLQNYHGQNFISTDRQYFGFDELLAEQSNISFFVHFKNASPVLRGILQPAFSANFKQNNSGWKDYYAAELQFTASDNSFYTNFYLQEKQILTKKDSIPL